MTWQAKAALTRAPRAAKLVVVPGTPCHYCQHPKSSHSSLVLTAPCRVATCDCPVFDPLCGCGHLLSEHVWGVSPHPWECAFCKCLKFGADVTGLKVRAERAEVHSARPVGPPLAKPKAEVFAGTSPDGAYCRWGRRDLALYDCHQTGCQDKATYWTTRAYSGRTGKWTTAKANFCGPHFRRWANKYMPPAQLTLFTEEPAPKGS